MIFMILADMVTNVLRGVGMIALAIGIGVIYITLKERHEKKLEELEKNMDKPHKSAESGESIRKK
jgi:hypothetical protein